MRYAIIRDGIVENLTEWDGNTETWQPPAGTTAEVCPTGAISIGWEWNDGAPFNPNPPAEPQIPATQPIETSKLRFALELKARGMWPTIKAAIEANEDASMYWDFTDIVRSDNQMLLAMASQLNISTAQVREIITAAIARQV